MSETPENLLLPSTATAPSSPGDNASKNPYVGPRPFEIREQRLFFGRDWEAEELVALIVAHPAVLFYAQSGAGKSSLLNARIVPKLTTEEGCEVLPVARVRGDIPEGIRTDRIENLYVFNTLLNWTEETAVPPEQLINLSLADFLGLLPHQSDKEDYPALRILIFDQFEELFTFYPQRWPEREKFFAQVNAALADDSLLRVLFVIREDYLAQLDPYLPTLPEQLRYRFRLERLRHEAALAAVVGPLQGTGRSFAPGVAEALVAELLKIRVEGWAGEVAEAPGEFVEPVQLQVVCQSLWNELPPEVIEITESQLLAFGNVDQALTKFYETALQETMQRLRLTSTVARLAPIYPEWQLRNWFERDLVTPAGTRGLVYRGVKTSGGVPDLAVNELERRHLIRAEQRAGARWYELTHDRLIRPIQSSNTNWRIAKLKQAGLIGGSVIALVLIILAVNVIFNAQIAANVEAVAAATATAIRRVEAAATAAVTQVAQVEGTAQAVAVQVTEVHATAQVAAVQATTVSEYVSHTQATAAAAATKQAQTEAIAAYSGGVSPTEVSMAQAEAATANAQAATAVALLQMETGTPLPTATFAPSPTATASPTSTTTPTSTSTPSPTPTDTPTPSPEASVAITGPTETPTQTPTPTPTATPTNTPTPIISWPPPNRIIFTSARLSAADLYIMKADGSAINPDNSKVMRLTLSLGFEASYPPGKDPAVDLITFTSLRDKRVSLFTINPDGRNETNIGGREWDNWEPALSPDGRRVAFVSSRLNRNWEIYSMNLDGSDPHWLTENLNEPDQGEVKFGAPAWSPNGRQIAFVVEGPDQVSIWLMNADGSRPRQLTGGGAANVYPAWSPDGRQIAYASSRSGNADIYVFDLESGRERNLTQTPNDENYPAWSLDGNWLAFSGFTTNNEIFIMTTNGQCPPNLPDDQVKITTGSDNCMINLTQNNDSDWAPVWIR
jgi:dipeptidyl aminopeptidase/acylaminoacyl peptidase